MFWKKQHAAFEPESFVATAFATAIAPGTDVMIFKTFSPKNVVKKIGVFDSKQS
jgi:hypothetical protein